MKCIRCGGRPEPGFTTMTLERGATTLVVQRVPAQVCPDCSEGYVSADTTDRVRKLLNVAVASGVKVAVQHFGETQHGQDAEEPSGSRARA